MKAFKVALIKSETQFVLRSFETDSDNDSIKICDLEELSKKALQAIFVPLELRSNLSHVLETLEKTTPVRRLEDFSVTSNQWSELSREEIFKLTTQAMTPWMLHNGISLVEELKPVSEHLKELWPNDRTSFFEELWSLTKRTWGTTELKMIYNDLANQVESDKNKLVRSMISGKRVGHPQEAGEIEIKIMDHYQGEYTRAFDIVDFDEEKGELVAIATIAQSPVVIMAKVLELSRLQKAIIQATIESLS
jgi:hypothetical protein